MIIIPYICYHLSRCFHLVDVYSKGFVKVIIDSPFCKVSHSVSTTFQQPFSCEQSFNANWTSGVNAPSTDANFCPKAKAEAVCKASACVVEHTCAVNALQELGGCARVV